jgi:cyclopropane fatty-acyl-phospholipid synthase-like methyltransferase
VSALAHYTKFNQAYQSAYGDVIQACRGKDINKMLHQIGVSAQLFAGADVVDCGGGFGYPAAFFTSVFDCNVTSLNITDAQLEIAKSKYSGMANFIKHDFDHLGSLGVKADRVLFLETIGHSMDITSLMRQCYDMLSDDGIVFIKHPSCSRDNPRFDRVSDFYSYKFYSRNDIVGAAINAGLAIEKVSNTYCDDWDFDFQAEFLKFTQPDDCVFVDFNDPRYTDLLFTDFVFKKVI